MLIKNVINKKIDSTHENVSKNFLHHNFHPETVKDSQYSWNSLEHHPLHECISESTSGMCINHERKVLEWENIKIVAKSCQELSKENFIFKKIWEKIENFPSFYNSLRHRRRVITASLLMNLLKQFHSIYFLCQRECCDLDVCLFACVINKSSETQECINKK